MATTPPPFDPGGSGYLSRAPIFHQLVGQIRDRMRLVANRKEKVLVELDIRGAREAHSFANEAEDLAKVFETWMGAAPPTPLERLEHVAKFRDLNARVNERFPEP